MDRMPTAADLTTAEYAALRQVAGGFIGRTISKAHQTRLVQLGLIQSLMGGLVITPAGRMVARL